MSFDWSEFLKLARKLAEKSELNREAALRSAISRAYYAAFLLARNHLRDEERRRTPRGRNAHIYVRDQFLDSREQRCTEIGDNLNALRTYRNIADYDDTLEGFGTLDNLAAADEALQMADDVISGLTTLKP